jgi:hypothetical protein
MHQLRIICPVCGGAEPSDEEHRRSRPTVRGGLKTNGDGVFVEKIDK